MKQVKINVKCIEVCIHKIVQSRILLQLLRAHFEPDGFSISISYSSRFLDIAQGPLGGARSHICYGQKIHITLTEKDWSEGTTPEGVGIMLIIMLKTYSP